MSPGFSVEISHLDGDIKAAELHGELDQATVPELQRSLDAVIDSGTGGLLIDLSSCEFIDSSGLAALVGARERLAALGGRRFGICCPGSQVSRLLEITGLDRAMGLADSRDDALAALRDGASATT